jgi:hypothetical protein
MSASSRLDDDHTPRTTLVKPRQLLNYTKNFILSILASPAIERVCAARARRPRARGARPVRRPEVRAYSAVRGGRSSSPAVRELRRSR